MLLGQFDVKVGDQGRVALPRRFRGELGDTIIVTYGFEGSLLLVSQTHWKVLLEGTENRSFLQSNTRDVQRYLLGGASIIELDSQGRFVIPEYLREFAGIKNEISLIGLNKYVEVWDSKMWHEQRSKISKDITKVADNLLAPLEGKGNE